MSFPRHHKGPVETEIGYLPLPDEPIVYADLAQNVYYPHNNHLPANIHLFEECPEEYQWWGYFGKSYFEVDPISKKLNFIIAHRGTDNFFGVVEDLELWLEYIIPAQYRECARPFMLRTIQNFYNYAAEVYPDYEISYQVTGHSLGACLAEKTVLDPKLKAFEFKGMLFENPGLPPSQMPKELHTLDLDNRLVLINTKPDAINTAYPTPTKFQFHINIDNQVYPRIYDLPLPFIPNPIYYALPYTFGVAHPIAGIIKALDEDDPLIPTTSWPHGLMAGFEEYKSLNDNEAYWNGYINVLWNENGIESVILQYLFGQNFSYFENFYKDYFLNADSQSLTLEQIKPLLNKLNNVEQVWESIPVAYKNAFQNLQEFSSWLNAWRTNIQDQVRQLRQPVTHPLINKTLFNTNQLIKTSLKPEPHLSSYNPKLIVEALIEFRFRLNFHNRTLGKMKKSEEQALIQQELKIISSKYQLPPEILLQTSQHTARKNGLLTIPSNKVNREDYLQAVLSYLSERIANLPKYNKEGNLVVKRIKLTEIYDEINSEQFTLEELKIKVGKIREVVAEHRDRTGIKGFFNQLRDTDSLQKLNEIFDQENNLKQDAKSYYHFLQFK